MGKTIRDKPFVYNEGILHHEILPVRVLRKDNDYILIDCMPNALVAADSVIIPVTSILCSIKRDETKRESVRNIWLEEISDFLNHPSIILKLASDETTIIMAVEYYIFRIADYFSMCSQSINIIKFS